MLLTELYPYVQKFAELFEAGKNLKWSIQIKEQGAKDVEYWEQKRELRIDDWIDHFQQKTILMKRSVKTWRSCIALRLKAEDNDQVKLFCVDADNEQAVIAIHEKLIPELEKRGIQYIWESSGLHGEKGHLWIKTFCTVQLQKLWAIQLFQAAGLDAYDKKLKFELFPALKSNFIIRAPGGRHMRTGLINVCTRGNQSSDEPLAIMRMFLEMPGIGEAEMRSQIVANPHVTQERVKLAPVRRAMSARTTFFYSSANLPVPVDGLPTVLQAVAQNCQAINWLLNAIVNENYANERGGDVHSAVLYLWGIALYNDMIQGGKHAPEGERWAADFFGQYRTRPDEAHRWTSEKEKFEYEKERLVRSCKRFEEVLGMCDGCRFKDRPGFRNPKQFHWGKKVKREALRPLKLVTQDWVRKNTFVQVRNRVRQLVELESRERKNILVCSPQGTGKSVMIDDCAVDIAQIIEVAITAVDVARRNKKVLISVPTGDLAVEHVKRINEKGKEFGIKAFMMGSQPTLFEKYIPNFKPGFPECPFQEEINKHKDLGIGSSIYKEKYCGNCVYEGECPFPNQYTQCQEEEYQVVVVQHAHFTSPQAMESILKKRFDVMFIDEAIVDALITNLKAREAEWELLESLESSFDWCGDLARWMRDGGYPASKKRINLDFETADAIKKVFSAHGVDWRLPDFVRYYNQGSAMDANLGLWIFTPLPGERIPICVITDATPPLEIYEIMLDDKNIETYGAEEILDYRKMNPKNKVIQVLDSSMSKTSLRGPVNEDGAFDYVRFCEILDFIADKARGDYKDKKILITVYGGEFWKVAEDYLTRSYPDIGFGERVILGKMSIGTNKFEDCDVQFLVAGVYLSGRDFHMQSYKFRVMANYWNRIRNRPTLPNFFHYGVGAGADIERIEEPVYRIEAINNHCYVFKYPDFKYFRPVETFHWLAEKYMIAKTQQSLRLRYNNDREKITYVFGKYFFPSFLITDSVLEEELLGYLRVTDEQEV